MQKFRYVAPEGGWGILICIGASMPFGTALGILPSFGLVFGDFFKGIGAETSEMNFVCSSFFLCISTAGLLSGSLFKRYGLRRVALIGGLLYTLGSFLQIFVYTTLHLLVAFSLLQGLGFGIIVPAFYTIFNDYFVEKRVVWMSFAQALIGTFVMCFPVIMHALLEKYGFRGSLAILGAINANAILGMLVMHPVIWHMRKVPLNEQELCEKGKESQSVSKTDLKEDQQATSPLMTKIISSNVHSRSSSIKSIGNWTGAVVVSDASPAMTRHHSILEHNMKKDVSKWQEIVEFLDLGLFKNPTYMNISLGVSIVLYSDIAFFTLQSMYLFELGFTKQETSRIIAIGAAADLLSRICLAFSTVCLKTASRNIYFAGSLFSVLSRFAFFEVHDFVGVACITAVMGFLRTWVHVTLPLVYGEYLPKERFATGYGLFMFMQGVMTFVLGPIIGYIRDTTKSYILTFHVLNFLMAILVVSWTIEYAYVKFVKKQKINMPMSIK